MKNIIQPRLVQALKDGQKELVVILRSIINEFTKAEKSGNALSDSDYLDVLKKMAKQRRQSIEEYTKYNRNDLAQVEQYELEVIDSYLPKALSEHEVREAIQIIIDANQLEKNPKSIGVIMKLFNSQYPAQNSALVSQVAKELIS
jgi:uncharacterized protein YqeY